MIEPRMATAIHESGHAVVSYLLGVPILHIALLSEIRGEMVPGCAWCPMCIDYYCSHNPSEDEHSRSIQNILRCQAAIAVAGEIAERRLCGDDHEINPDDLAQDRYKACQHASAIHYHYDNRCFVDQHWNEELCSTCGQYLKEMRASVEVIIKKRNIRKAIRSLAVHLYEGGRIEGDRVWSLLYERRASYVQVGELPEAPVRSKESA
jgi:hypothetical protein